MVAPLKRVESNAGKHAFNKEQLDNLSTFHRSDRHCFALIYFKGVREG